MERKFEPFEVVEEDSHTILRLHGTERERKEIGADRIDMIYSAMRQGWGIDIDYADIKGYMAIENAGLERDKGGRSIVPADVSFCGVNFQEWADFGGSVFRGQADFSGSVFRGQANFSRTVFPAQAVFSGVEFREVYFRRCQFREAYFGGSHFQRGDFGVARFHRADFTGSHFQRGDFRSSEFQEADFSGSQFQTANFVGAKFHECADFSGTSFNTDPKLDEAKHDSLSSGSLDSIGWAYRKSFLFGAGYFFERAGEEYWNATEYAKASVSFRNAKVEYEKEGKYDEAGDMYVWEKDSTRRQLRFQRGERLKWIWFWTWKHVSNYGEAPLRFIRVAGIIIAGFAILYMPIISSIPVVSDWFGWWPSITFEKYPFHDWSAGFINGYVYNFMTAFYFSAVTFATLGFGDIAPVSIVGKFFTVVQVLLGYVMFGILITLVARKMTRS